MKTRSKIVAVAVPLALVLLGLVAYENVYLGLDEELRATKAERMVKTKTLRKYMAIMAEQPVIQKKLLDLKEIRKADDSRILDGRTPALCAATLQEMVKGIISARGGAISSARVEKPENDAAFRIVTISVDASLPDAKALSDSLYDIETRTPSLVAQEVDARVKNMREPRELLVKLKISGLMAGK